MDDAHSIQRVSRRQAWMLLMEEDLELAGCYGDPSLLFSGEVGRMYSVRFVEDGRLSNDLPPIDTSELRSRVDRLRRMRVNVDPRIGEGYFQVIR